MEKQTTISREVSVEGVGLHTGNKCKVTFKPAAAGYGVHFTRVDLPGSPSVEANFRHVLGVTRGTVIGGEKFQVHTVEHILAACAGLRIDNIQVCINNNEPPVLDGSAREFANKLHEAGIKELEAGREYFTLSKPVIFESGNTKLAAYPADKLSIDCTIGYDHPFLKHQQASLEITPEIFLKEISSARTFCFDYEIEALHSKGLAKGGDFSNAIIIGPNGIHNPDKKLRYPDEFVRHKILDLIGDLSLMGKPLKARIVAERCGHANNIKFARLLEEEATRMSNSPTLLDINAIHKLIPHRYPFLMIDRAEVLPEEKKAKGFKCVSGNENFFQGHFPGRPIMPGVLIIEAMAQTTCVMFLSNPSMQGKLAYFMSIDGVKFRKPVVPGDVLELRVEVTRARERGGKAKGEAYVNNELVAEAEFMFAIVDREGQQ
jgi:UDP-3-O-[3-hydroxymyristoyl] N-acetylglucosamine deacetylase / 3-hydroxyacyl-[acyl-carrier-protein] dehydratase